MQAFLYQSGPACQIYLLADGSHCPAEVFLTTAADLHPDEFAKLTTAAKWKKAYETAKKTNKLKFSGDNE
jgi:hypothetical protein